MFLDKPEASVLESRGHLRRTEAGACLRLARAASESTARNKRQVAIKHSHVVKQRYIRFPMGHMDAKKGSLIPVISNELCWEEETPGKRDRGSAIGKQEQRWVRISWVREQCNAEGLHGVFQGGHQCAPKDGINIGMLSCQGITIPRELWIAPLFFLPCSPPVLWRIELEKERIWIQKNKWPGPPSYH